ncbi:protein disulfide-isomerase [Paludibacterium paludis]|uniref:Thiol:disulfide interchange protein n=2 Tax=Paludibacterium paludis TaxID=1225769 RepID=A0A918P0C5_9NEIS|nr:protein disulfide-isomerase [Paludibacterium paludis]
MAGFMLQMVACSAGNAVEPESLDSVKAAFQKRFADRKVLSVAKTPVKGMYEIVLKGNQVIYSDQKAEYLFIGDLIDVKKNASLTEKRQSELNRIDWSSLPLDLAVKEVRGNGERRLAVFTDPDCPFCKKLEREGLNGVTNVTIYTFLYPLTDLHPDARRKSLQVWCSKDRVAAWSGFMLEGRALSGPTDCANPLDRIKALGEKLGITGTPGLIFGNGQMVAGAIDRSEIEELLNRK